MKTVSLKKAIKLVFPTATDIKITNGYRYRSGFFNLGEQTMYFSCSEIGSNVEKNVMYRTAQHRKDYTGGSNIWGFGDKLNNLGYSLTINPTKKDYNSW